MADQLTALADALLEGGCGESCDALCAKAGNVLRTLAAADAGMPVVAYAATRLTALSERTKNRSSANPTPKPPCSPRMRRGGLLRE